MDASLRELERSAKQGDVEAALRLAAYHYRLIEHLQRRNEFHPSVQQISGPREVDVSPGSPYYQYQEAMLLVGSLVVEPFVIRFNQAIESLFEQLWAEAPNPFNPMGISSVAEPGSGYIPPYWWATLKECYGLTPEYFGGRGGGDATNKIPAGQGGKIPGFQKPYGLEMEYHLYPDGRKNILVMDTVKTNATYKWLGRDPDAMQYYGHGIPAAGGGFPPEGWVDQRVFMSRSLMLRGHITRAIRWADPEIDVRFSTGRGFQHGTLPPIDTDIETT